MSCNHNVDSKNASCHLSSFIPLLSSHMSIHSVFKDCSIDINNMCQFCKKCPCVWYQGQQVLTNSINQKWSTSSDGKIIDQNGDIIPNNKIRYFLYQSFIKQHYGILGYGNRVKLPECVINGIKNTFPDPHGEYKGFLLH